MYYVLRRTNQGGGWVSKMGSLYSYTHALQRARLFYTKEEAERQRCKGNEVVETLEQITACSS